MKQKASRLPDWTECLVFSATAFFRDSELLSDIPPDC